MRVCLPRSAWVAPVVFLIGLSFGSVRGAASSTEDPLLEGFRDPPQSARPRVWWHWMNGNITEEGIRRDLEWMKRTGLGGVQVFDAALETPQVVDTRLVYMTAPWQKAFQHAVTFADQLGLEVSIAASPGWSETGGPWVPPRDAMKKLVWSTVGVEGGQRIRRLLPRPPGVTGPFQDVPLFDSGSSSGTPEFYEDVAVVAYPILDQKDPAPVQVIGPAGAVASGTLRDGRLDSGVAIASSEPSWIRCDFEESVTISAVTLGMTPAGHWKAELEASDDAISFRRVGEFPAHEVPRFAVAQQTLSFAPLTARYFRLALLRKPRVPTPYTTAPGAVLPAPVASAAAEPLRLTELRFHANARINHFEQKAGFGVAQDYYTLDTPDTARVLPVSPSQVKDLTGFLRSDGTLIWDAPPGRWEVMRYGYTLTGKQNHPAPPEATGLEVDKLDRAAVKRYATTYLDMMSRAAGSPMPGIRGVRALLNDSTEVGAQNWTPSLPQEFRARRGYDPTPWLPTLAGVIVGSASKSDAFLYDFRRTLGELLAESHYAELTAAAHARGLIHYTEALEGWRMSLGDDMDMRRSADIPMAAMWTFARGGAPLPQHVADIRGAASVAHLYGQNIAAAESLTSAFSHWAFSPRDLQPMIDFAFASGINLPVIHTSVHQPTPDKKPGMTLSDYGQDFTRHETWADEAASWVDYLSRTSFLLQQGRFVADVAYFYGEEAPLSGLFHSQYAADVPQRYAYDFLNADALFNRLTVVDGRLTTRSGMRYAALYLGGSTHRMTLAALRRIRDLVVAGATVVGESPERSPALADDDQEFQRLVNELWPSRAGSLSLGKGRVFRTHDIETALRDSGVAPDFDYVRSRPDSDVLFVHRKLTDADVYFLTNRRDRMESIAARFRVTGKRPELWNARTGRIQPVSYWTEGGSTVVPLELSSLDSAFIVFREPAERPSWREPPLSAVPLQTLVEGWTLHLDADGGAHSAASPGALGAWNECKDASIRYFSGTGAYRRALNVPQRWLRDYDAIWLDLGLVREIAQIFVNGKPVEVLWREPYRTDISKALAPGRNQIEVRVTNLWVNRLIGDAQSSTHPATFTTSPTYLPDAPLRLSGMVGPVTLVGQKKSRSPIAQSN